MAPAKKEVELRSLGTHMKEGSSIEKHGQVPRSSSEDASAEKALLAKLPRQAVVFGRAKAVP